MITQSRTHIAFIGLLISLALFLSTAVQALVHFAMQGINESKHMRVIGVSACSTSADGAHFVGCSSIL